MTRLLVVVCVALVCACGGGAPDPQSSAVFTLATEGNGPELLTAVPHDEVVRWSYMVEGADQGSSFLRDSYYRGTVTLPNGTVAQRYVTVLEVLYEEHTADGQYLWGGSGGDVFETPFVQLSYPLKRGREWHTGNAEFPDWYRYLVDATEKIETPAGTFDAVRVSQINTRTQDTVARWYVQDVGMVARYGKNVDGALVKTTLVRFASEGGAP